MQQPIQDVTEPRFVDGGARCLATGTWPGLTHPQCGLPAGHAGDHKLVFLGVDHRDAPPWTDDPIHGEQLELFG